jgi:hypothetical protein
MDFENQPAGYLICEVRRLYYAPEEQRSLKDLTN